MVCTNVGLTQTIDEKDELEDKPTSTVWMSWLWLETVWLPRFCIIYCSLCTWWYIQRSPTSTSDICIPIVWTSSIMGILFSKPKPAKSSPLVFHKPLKCPTRRTQRRSLRSLTLIHTIESQRPPDNIRHANAGSEFLHDSKNRLLRKIMNKHLGDEK